MQYLISQAALQWRHESCMLAQCPISIALPSLTDGVLVLASVRTDNSNKGKTLIKKHHSELNSNTLLVS